MEERIKYLFRQYLQNTCSRKEFEEFLAYVRESAHDEQLRTLIQQAYNDAGQGEAARTYVDEYGNLVLLQPDGYANDTSSPEPIKTNKKRVFAIAAVVIVIITTGILWLTREQLKQQPGNTVMTSLVKKSTERSEYKYLLLPDSTQVWLNAASILEFPKEFKGQLREVYLSGEAYFDVKHADRTPFVIHTGKVSTTVLGTAFNINAYPGRKNVIVAVSRGKVRVSFDNREVATLTKGQQVRVDNEENKPAEKKQVNANVASWQQGNLVYEDERLEDIIADMERIYNVRVKIIDAALGNTTISTSFRRDIGVEQALHVLCKLTDTELQQTNGEYLIH
ncbi:MAG: FecR domain-containing protein [Chitinophagaceae bacterium]